MRMIGRVSERDTIWRTLRSLQGPSLLVLRGEPGCGKTRLAEWICQRAHELGAATVLEARHGSTPGPGQGLASMMARHLRTYALPQPEVAARIEAELSGYDDHDEPVDDVEALTELVSPGSSLQLFGDPAQLPNPSHRSSYVQSSPSLQLVAAPGTDSVQRLVPLQDRLTAQAPTPSVHAVGVPKQPPLPSQTSL